MKGRHQRAGNRQGHITGWAYPDLSICDCSRECHIQGRVNMVDGVSLQLFLGL